MKYQSLFIFPVFLILFSTISNSYAALQENVVYECEASNVEKALE